MKYAALVLVLAAVTTASASQVMVQLVDGRATCTGFDPDKLSVVERAPDWRVTVAGTDGYSVAILSSKEDAEASMAVIQKKKYTAVCTIGKGARTFRYFESAR